MFGDGVDIVRNCIRDLNPRNVSMGLVSGLMAYTGPPVIMLDAALKGNFTVEQTVFWMFSVYFFGGLFSIIMPIVFKIPATGAHSITGVTFLATVVHLFPYSELIGAYIMGGILIFLTGAFKLFSKLMKYVPREIFAAMMAGLIAGYVVRMIDAVHDLPIVGGAALLAFFLLSKWNGAIPPVVGAVIAGIAALFLTRDFPDIAAGSSFFLPEIQIPAFSPLAFFSVSIPLALLILSNDIAPGLSGLEQNRYHPPVNRLVAFSGLFSSVSGLFGGQSANLAGMMTAICSGEEAGPREKRYMASVVSGAMLLVFGVFAWKVVPFVQALPRAFVALLAGFSLIGVMASSLNLAFSRPGLRLGTTFAFAIAASDFSLFYINAPIWALLGGTLIARWIERQRAAG